MADDKLQHRDRAGDDKRPHHIFPAVITLQDDLPDEQQNGEQKRNKRRMVVQRLRKMAPEKADKGALQATARAFQPKVRFKKAGKQMLLQPIDHLFQS